MDYQKQTTLIAHRVAAGDTSGDDIPVKKIEIRQNAPYGR
jgi:hypothetical protein